MWPKVFAQLVELLPHVSRLIPMADKFFASKSASEKANETAITAMAEHVRADLGEVTAAHAGMYRQLQDQGTQLAAIADEVKQNRVAVEGETYRIALLEKQLASLGLWIKTGVLLLLAAFAILITLVLRPH
ncbi:hypothetical protein [Granulicella arctica]|uniref:hypothetical protein n=1 Tax=Granulicella arctica TaxID=940613 RepID=UPI0021E0F299|nr:hypothetical protein [Granulicella arctica]